jgi:hypothetical protein
MCLAQELLLQNAYIYWRAREKQQMLFVNWFGVVFSSVEDEERCYTDILKNN